jgi:hypothetical protein
MVLAFMFKRSSGQGDGQSPVKPVLGRLFGTRPSRPAVQPNTIKPIEDYDLNDVGLVRGAVPHTVWEWRRRRRGV